MKNVPNNLNLISSKIQKDIASVISREIVSIIFEYIGDSLFSIIIDKSRDISLKEKMIIFVHYVDKKGCVIECLIGF